MFDHVEQAVDDDDAVSMAAEREPTGPVVEVSGSGHLPVLVHVPHAGSGIPDQVRAGILLDDNSLAAEADRVTDHRADVLARGARERGATVFTNRLSPLVVDPDRHVGHAIDVGGGAGRVALDVLRVSTSRGEVLRRPGREQREALLDRWWRPYVAALARTVDELVVRHGHCTIVSLHTAARLRPGRSEADAAPEVGIATDPVHTPEWLADVVEDFATAADRQVLRRAARLAPSVPPGHRDHSRVTAVGLVIRRDLHLDEDTGMAHAGEPDMVAFVAGLVSAVAARTPDEHG